MSARGEPPTGGERTTTRIKSGAKRKASSRRWLERQLNDPYVAAARRQGYRSRAAFKLAALDDRFHLLKPGARVVDLGAAPGGWAQVAATRVRAGEPGGGRVVAVDVTPLEALPGVIAIAADAREPETARTVEAALGGPADLVLSDMAPPSTGHRATDHLRIVALCEAAFEFACQTLAPGGGLVVKVWQGGTEGDLLARIKRRFGAIRHAKPPASRDESPEVYLVATGFRPDPG